MNSNFTIFIKILSGDIITTEFNKNETGIELRKRIQEIYPEFEWQRQVLIPQYHFHLDNDLLIDPITLFELQDLSKVQQGDILYLFVLDPFTEYIRYTGSITSTVSANTTAGFSIVYRIANGKQNGMNRNVRKKKGKKKNKHNCDAYD